MRNFFDATMIRFALVGVVNTVVGSAVMFACYNLLGLSYWISSIANYVIGSIVSYFLNKNFTFRNKEKGIKPIIRFVINIAVCYGLAYGIARPVARMMLKNFSMTIQDNVAMAIGMCAFVVFNYFGQRFFAFKENNESAGE